MEGIEPAARADVHFPERVQLSIAISLKRIADAITGDGESILTTPINAYGESIGSAIQGQMVRGAQGISEYDR